jgi:hypothetical protein
MEHAQLLEVAFVNYLAGLQSGNPLVTIWPAGLNIYPGENNLDKNGIRIVCYVEGNALGDEEPPNSGNRRFEISCQLRTPIRKLTADEIENNTTDPFAQHQATATLLSSAILSNNLPTLLENSQAGLTVFGLTNRTQFREQNDGDWVTGWKVSGLSCPCTFIN